MKRTTESYIAEAIKFHGEERYDYSKTVYTKIKDKIIIFCLVCKLEFQQTAEGHLKYGCKKCGKRIASKDQVKTTVQFIDSAKKQHGEKYNYDKTIYINAKNKVIIFCINCKKEFEQLPRFHIMGQGCPDCGKKQKAITNTKNIEYFVNNAREIHGDKYNYDNFEYINATTKSKIFCNKCKQIFLQDAHSHVGKSAGCPACGYEAMRKARTLTLNNFVEKAKKVHGDKYDYDSVIYTNSQDYIEIGCRSCKIFFYQKGNAHLMGQGCKQCSRSKMGNKRLSNDEFISRCIEIHKEKYDYSDTIYTIGAEKIKINCRRCNTTFMQTAWEHAAGNGCPRCNFSKGEIQIENYLLRNKIDFKTQYKFADCKYIRLLLFDFYIERYNLIIEFDGNLHFQPLAHFGGEEALKIRQIRDNIKNEYCINNGINMLRIKYDENIEDKLDTTIVCLEMIDKLSI